MLLSCRRFSEPPPHTGQQIAAALEDELESAEINEIDFIISDNATNMRSAFTTAFPMSEQTILTHYASDSDNCLDDEDNDLFLDLSCEKAVIEETINDCSRQRLSCLAHTLQLMVRDGLWEAVSLSFAIAKASRLSTLLHRSTTRVSQKIMSPSLSWPYLLQ